MLKPARGLERWALINASPEAVFAYLADLPRHGEWDAQTGFRMVRASDGPVAAGSYCQRERIETFQAPILRGGATNSRVSWVKSLTVTGCLSNQALDFEKKISTTACLSARSSPPFDCSRRATRLCW